MGRFAFTPVDAEAEQFCWEIVRALMDYGLSEGEALYQLNVFWKGQTIGGKDEVVYHLGVDEWTVLILERRAQTH